MQYTGHKDKNDTVEGESERDSGVLYEYLKPIVFHRELSAFEFLVTVDGNFKLPLEHYNNLFANVSLGQSEVIGDIYEKPEFLNEAVLNGNT